MNAGMLKMRFVKCQVMYFGNEKNERRFTIFSPRYWYACIVEEPKKLICPTFLYKKVKFGEVMCSALILVLYSRDLRGSFEKNL